MRPGRPDKAILKVSSTMSYGGYAPSRVEDVTAPPDEPQKKQVVMKEDQSKARG